MSYMYIVIFHDFNFFRMSFEDWLMNFQEMQVCYLPPENRMKVHNCMLCGRRIHIHLHIPERSYMYMYVNVYVYLPYQQCWLVNTGWSCYRRSMSGRRLSFTESGSRASLLAAVAIRRTKVQSNVAINTSTYMYMYIYMYMYDGGTCMWLYTHMPAH